jgi:hypothetical protein
VRSLLATIGFSDDGADLGARVPLQEVQALDGHLGLVVPAATEFALFAEDVLTVANAIAARNR